MADPPNTNNPAGTGAANVNAMPNNGSGSSSATPRASSQLAAANNPAGTDTGTNSSQMPNIDLSSGGRQLPFASAAPVEDTSGPMGRAKFRPINEQDIVYREPSDWDIARAEFQAHRDILHKQKTIREKFNAAVTKVEDLARWYKEGSVNIVVGKGVTAQKVDVICPRKLFLQACPKADRYFVNYGKDNETVELPGDIRLDFAKELVHAIAHGEDIDAPDNILDLDIRGIIDHFRLFVYMNLHREAKKWEDILIEYFREYKLPLITSEVSLIWHNFQEQDDTIAIMLAHVALAKKRGELIDQDDLLKFARRTPFFAMALSNAFRQGDRIPQRAVDVSERWRNGEGLDHPLRAKGLSLKNSAAKRQEDKEQKKRSRSERNKAAASGSSAPPTRPLPDLPTSDDDEAERAGLRKGFANLTADAPQSQSNTSIGNKSSSEPKTSSNPTEASAEAQRMHDARVRRRFERLSIHSSEEDLTNLPSSSGRLERLSSGRKSSGTQSSGLQSSGGQASGTRSSHSQPSGSKSYGTEAPEDKPKWKRDIERALAEHGITLGPASVTLPSGTKSIGNQNLTYQSSSGQSSRAHWGSYGGQSSGGQSSGGPSSGGLSAGGQTSEDTPKWKQEIEKIVAENRERAGGSIGNQGTATDADEPSDSGSATETELTSKVDKGKGKA